MTCLISLQREMAENYRGGSCHQSCLPCSESEVRAELSYLISKYQCRASLASAWYHPLTSMMGGGVDRGAPIRAHHAHHPLNADRQEARHTNDNHHLYTI